MERNPNLKPFVPGQSGNPSGKRKGTVSVTAAIRRQLAEGDDAEAIAAALIRGARAGDIRHIVEILNRVDGKVPDRFAGPEGEPLTGDLSRLSTDELVAFRTLLAKLAG